jgi:hypothetical protein
VKHKELRSETNEFCIKLPQAHGNGLPDVVKIVWAKEHDQGMLRPRFFRGLEKMTRLNAQL